MSDGSGTDAERRPLVISGEGVRVETVPGVAARSRSGDAGSDGEALAHAIERTEGLRMIDSATITRLELTAQGTRGSAADGALSVPVGLGDEERGVVLVQEGERFTWAIPQPGADRVQLPIEALPGSRGFLPKAVRRVVHLIGVKTVGWAVQKATNTFVGAWDQRRHPYGLRAWTPDNHRITTAPEPDWPALTAGPALLVIHGFTGSIHGSFGDLPVEVVGRIHSAYGGRTLAFDHPTLALSPEKNAEWLRDRLLATGVPLELDVLAHSRGGLVARELAQRMAGNGITVRSVTFVATPNDGTPLADPARPKGLLDALTNLVGAVPGSDVVELVMELLKDVVLESALDGLPGLLDMKPGGPYLQALNGIRLSEDLCVRSISADFEPRSDAGIVQTAHNRAVDLYFGGLRNDLIVPTLSTIVTSGAFSVPAEQRLVLDSSRGVDHSSFWTNGRATQQLTDWLRPDWPERPPVRIPPEESEPAAETALAPDPMRIEDVARAVAKLPKKARDAVHGLLGGPLNEAAKKPTGTRPAVVVVPGLMGTHLANRNGELIWIDSVRLRRGRFGDLVLPAVAGAEIGPAGLHNTYLPLISHLAQSWDVYLAPYDWRGDIRSAAKRLAALLRDQVFPSSTDRPIHIVAHSMGGLVARAMAHEASDVWKKMGSDRRSGEGQRSGRLVMLGTPNKGSYATVLMLAGGEMILNALAAADVRSSAHQLLDVVATFRGVYQMLPARTARPSDDDHHHVYDVSKWKAASRLSRELLLDAEAFHQEMAEVRDPDRLVCVVGHGHPTPFRLELSNGSFTVGRIRRGDGRVAIDLALLDGVTTYFTEANHGGLLSDKEILASLDDLLTTGSTKRLPDAEPVPRGDDALDKPAMIPVELFDAGVGVRGDGPGVDPVRAGAAFDDALRLTLGGGLTPRHRVRLELSVLHASLEQASHPVAVGHYARLPPEGAERFLDGKLNGALRDLHRVGQYPDRPGTAMYVPAPPDHRPRGGLVLGLGDFGTLTTATLTESMAQAVVARVLDDRQRNPIDAEPPPCGISSVLVGTPGRHGLSVESSVVALAEGVLQAVARLRTLNPPVTLETVQLELVELYEQRAEQAAVVISRIGELLEPCLLTDVEVVSADRLRTGEGAQPSAPPSGASGTPWVRVLVSLEELDPACPPPVGTIRKMRFSSLARGAQANLMEYDIDLAMVQDYVASAVRRVDNDRTVSRTLYEMLFPVRAKLDLDRSESLHLLVDDAMAEIPWELLAATSLSGDVTQLALRAGMLRQLHSTTHTRERSEAPSGRMALVVGDPPTSFARLPGARFEAGQVANMLEAREWDVERVIFGDEDKGDADEWTRVLDALIQHPYRVVHIAAHGVFDDVDRRASGVVIGPKPHHRLTSFQFEKMTVTPELVFLNCCHLGRFDDLSAELKAQDRKALEQPHKMAATVAQQLLRNGVRAVVAAGWAVDDNAASIFSEELYGAMLDGHPFGEAVRRARDAAHAADNGLTNTWGAYQCYGDPDFVLVAEGATTTRRTPIVSTAQLAREFGLASIRAGNSVSQEHCEEVGRQVDALRIAGAELMDDSSVLEALGLAYSELGRHREAAAAYEQSMRHEKGGTRLRAIEQLANVTVRQAARLARTTDDHAEVGKLFDQACLWLDQLEALAGQTAERHALRGSLFKKRAAVTDDQGRKQELLIGARDQYLSAWEISSGKGKKSQRSYHTNLWLQTTALTDEKGQIDDEQSAWLEQLYKELRKGADPDRSGYWEVAAIADTLVTAVVVGREQLGGKPVQLGDAEERYTMAFNLRSTVRQRESALDHLDDLSRLLDGERGKEFRELYECLTAVEPGPG